MDAKLLGLNRIMLSMSNLSEYGELLSALFRLALMAEALGLPSLDDAEAKTNSIQLKTRRANLEFQYFFSHFLDVSVLIRCFRSNENGGIIYDSITSD